MFDIVVQLIGLIGYLVLVLSYFQKDKKGILFFQIISYLFFVIHYYLLDGLTGSLCNLIGLVSISIIYILDNEKKDKNNIVKLSLVPITLVLSLFTYNNIYSLFPIIATVSVILSFSFNNPLFIRFVGILSATCWLVYAIIYGSYAAIVVEVITIVSISYSIIYSTFINKKKKK